MKLLPGKLDSFPVGIHLESADPEKIAEQVYDTYSPAIYGFLIRLVEREVADKLLLETFTTGIKDIIKGSLTETRLLFFLKISQKLVQEHNPNIQLNIL